MPDDIPPEEIDDIKHIMECYIDDFTSLFKIEYIQVTISLIPSIIIVFKP